MYIAKQSNRKCFSSSCTIHIGNSATQWRQRVFSLTTLVKYIIYNTYLHCSMYAYCLSIWFSYKWLNRMGAYHPATHTDKRAHAIQILLLSMFTILVCAILCVCIRFYQFHCPVLYKCGSFAKPFCSLTIDGNEENLIFLLPSLVCVQCFWVAKYSKNSINFSCFSFSLWNENRFLLVFFSWKLTKRGRWLLKSQYNR